MKEGTFSGHKCRVLEEATVEGKKLLKLELVESKVILESIEEGLVQFTEKDDALANENAVLQAALRKEKEQNKLLRSQLEKQKESVQEEVVEEAAENIVPGDLPTEDTATEGDVNDPGKVDEGDKTGVSEADKTLPAKNDGATQGKVTDPGKVKESVEPVKEATGFAAIETYGEDLLAAGKAELKESVNQIIEANPAFAPYRSMLEECTTRDSLMHTQFKLNGYLQREAYNLDSFKESTEAFKSSGAYDNGDEGYLDSVDLGV